MPEQIRLKRGEQLVEVERSGVVESVHTGHVVVLGAEGDVVRTRGIVDQSIFPRSSVKPLQAAGLVRLGLRLPPTGLALAAASHSGEDEHVAVVRATLASAGLTEDDLQCPPDWPLSETARETAMAAGIGRTRVRMNCSGKHAAMLATCKLSGWPTDTYLRPDHPLQQALRETVADLASTPVAGTGVDGCGAPLFAITLIGLARAAGRIAAADPDSPEGLVADAMRAHPHLVAGRERSATRLMAGIPGLIAKDGAEGVYVAGLADGSAVAVKIDDGAARAAELVVVAGLEALGVEALVLIELSVTPVLGGGRTVGYLTVDEL